MRDHIRVNLLNLGWMDTPPSTSSSARATARVMDWLGEAEAEQPFGRLIKPRGGGPDDLLPPLRRVRA